MKYKVQLVNNNSRLLNCVRIIRQHSHLMSLKKAKELAERAPCDIFVSLNWSKAQEIAIEFNLGGAYALVLPMSSDCSIWRKGNEKHHKNPNRIRAAFRERRDTARTKIEIEVVEMNEESQGINCPVDDHGDCEHITCNGVCWCPGASTIRKEIEKLRSELARLEAENKKLKMRKEQDD